MGPVDAPVGCWLCLLLSLVLLLLVICLVVLIDWIGLRVISIVTNIMNRKKAKNDTLVKTTITSF
jgi:hypothetical protein